MSFPVINEFIKHVGVSYLRTFSAHVLRHISKSREMYVIMDNYTPVAVLIPYNQYLEMQNRIIDLTRNKPL